VDVLRFVGVSAFACLRFEKCTSTPAVVVPELVVG